MSARSTGPGRRFRRVLSWPVRVLVEPQSTPTIIAIVVLCALGAGYLVVRTAAANGAGSAAASGTPAPLWQPVPTPGARVTNDDPFAGTDAAALAIGEAGILMPPASALAGASEDEVSEALAAVRSALIAGRLDGRMLVGHDPSAFIALLAPSQRAAAAQAFATGRFGGMATWIDGSATPAGATPRVSGRISMRNDVDIRGRTYIEIVTNHVWVYPFVSAAYGRRLSTVHDQIHWWFFVGPATAPDDRGLHIAGIEYDVRGASCLAAKESRLTPWRPGEPLRGPRPASTADMRPVTPVNIFDPTTPFLTAAGGCDPQPLPPS